VRRFVLVAFLLALVGCQASTTDEPAAPTSTTSSPLEEKLESLPSPRVTPSVVPLTNDVIIGGPSTTRQPREGDGICSHEERDGGVDCR
jgi:hypothetical protein